MSVLRDALVLIREAEALVIGKAFRPKNRLVLDLVDSVLHGPWFIVAGMQNLFHMFVRWVTLLLVFSLCLYLVSRVSSDGRALSVLSALGGGGVFSAGAILFGLPSGFTTRGVRDSHVEALVHHIHASALDSSSRVLLRQGVEAIEAIGRQRISAIGGALGLIWAVLVWIVSQWVMSPDVPPSVRGNAMSYGFMGFLLFISLAIAFVSYREAHRLLSQTITFAFLEAEANQVATRTDA